MKPRSILLASLALVLAAGATAGCKKRLAGGSPPESPAFPVEKPVVDVPPVFTIPFEDGYKAGFERGKEDGAPRMELPLAGSVRELATEAATGDELRAQKWRDGWAEGYMDGFRQRATNAR